VFGHGLVFITTGFQQPELLAIRPDGRGDVTKTHVAWSLKRGAPLTPSPIIVGDELYIVNDGGIASCIDARTGSVIWQSRLGGTYSASPVYADGRLYFPAEQGVTTVIAPKGSAPSGDEQARRWTIGVNGRRRRLVLPANRHRALPD
jgi:outer membrane protein assembly factor BamB